MSAAQTPESAVDLLVVGGGVFGLWTARRARRAGLTVALVERRRIGWGASGGLLGALSAHAPDRWTPKKDFQFRALVELEDEIARLEAETGRQTGYARCGRLMPIRKQSFLPQFESRRTGAAAHWRAGGQAYGYDRRDDEAQSSWLASEAAPLGYVHDAFAARIAPRAYLGALRAALVATETAVTEGAAFESWDGAARLSDGRRLPAGAVALCAGFEGFDTLRALSNRDLGGGVFGQSALLRAPGFEARPLLYDDGVYVVPHDDGTIAVGSTDHKTWSAPNRPDPADDAFLARARALCPAIRQAEPIDWWAGVRPKAWTRDPLMGRLPVEAPVWTLNGGFKIGFGVAHRLAAALIDRLTGAADPTPIPDSFGVDAHLAAAERRAAAKGAAETAQSG